MMSVAGSPRSGSWGQELLSAAARELPGRRAQMLDLVYGHGLQQHDVAARLNMSVALVGAEIAAGLASIAELVAPRWTRA